MATEKRYCPACGHEQDENGICTNEKCPRRSLQVTLNEKQKAAEEAKEELKVQSASILSTRKFMLNTRKMIFGNP